MPILETESAAQSAAEDLRRLGSAARRLLAETVEHQGVTRSSVSKSARMLEDAGFVFIYDTGTIWTPEFTFKPSLDGEMALDALEEMQKSSLSAEMRE